jgi:ribosome maturation factor RimP
MDLPERIERMVAPTVEAMGFRVVRVQLSGKDSMRLQVMVEREDERPIQVDDCAAVSRAISAVLDVEDPIAGTYTLEVSSPGIDRPLVRLGDFQRFVGFEARVETARPIDGRRRFRGRLLGVAGESVRMAVEGAEVALPYDDIQRAKLVLTDELIAATGKR